MSDYNAGYFAAIKGKACRKKTKQYRAGYFQGMLDSV